MVFPVQQLPVVRKFLSSPDMMANSGGRELCFGPSEIFLFVFGCFSLQPWCTVSAASGFPIGPDLRRAPTRSWGTG